MRVESEKGQSSMAGIWLVYICLDKLIGPSGELGLRIQAQQRRVLEPEEAVDVRRSPGLPFEPRMAMGVLLVCISGTQQCTERYL